MGLIPGQRSKQHWAQRALVAISVAVFAVVVACGSPSGAEPNAVASPAGGADVSTPGTPRPASSPLPTPTPEPPLVDLTIHSVPLDQVIFDTFDGGATRLSDASESTIRRLRDAIRPVYEPVQYQSVDGGDWLSDSDTVMGYVSESGAFAYPIKFLNFHELVNDTIDGVPLIITYCPLCGSGVIYDRRLDGVTHVFGNTSALYENDLVMFDHATGSFWFQIGGEAIVGALTGSRLKPLPSATLPWGVWKELHPATQILARVQGFPSFPDYDTDPFTSYKARVDDLRFPFPVTEDKIDTRLPASTITLTVITGGMEKAYPVELMGDAVANDIVGGEPVVVFSRADGMFGTAFSRLVGGEALTFSIARGVITDAETGSTWSLFGEAVEGELSGASLRSLPTRRAFWFSIAIAVPGIEIWTATG